MSVSIHYMSVLSAHYHTIFYFFFFSSRRRHTRLQGDWSSDVCSSDLHDLVNEVVQTTRAGRADVHAGTFTHRFQTLENLDLRSEERRVGKECRYRRAAYH